MRLWPFGRRKTEATQISAGRSALEADAPLWAIRESAWESMEVLAAGMDMEGALEAYTVAMNQAVVPEKPYEMEGDVALIPVCGPLMKTSGFMCWWYGGTSMERLRGLLEAAGLDPDVKEVRLIFDTPGGQVAGAAVTAQAIRDLDKIKPVHAYLSDQCCSLGFWLASQCRTITANAETCEIGNVGTRCVVDDSSKMYALMGIERLVIRSTPLKGAGVPGTAITPAQKAEFQSQVDAANAVFLAEVAAGRKVSLSKVKSWATAHVYLGKEALAEGLIDKIEILSGEGVVEEDAAEDSEPDTDGDDLEGLNQSAEAQVSSASVLPGALNGEHSSSASLGEGQAPTLQDVGRRQSSPENVVGGQVARPTTEPKEAIRTPDAASAAPTLPASSGTIRGKAMALTLRDLLYKALNRVGLKQMAVSVVSAEDNAEELAAAMAQHVNEEVQERVEKHPLMQACDAAGIRSPDDLSVVMSHAKRGEEALADLRVAAKEQAIRAYGAENGLIIAQQVGSADYRTAKMLKEAWGKEADAKYGIGMNGEAPTRTSAPKQALAANAEETQQAEKPKSLWEQLTPTQQQYAMSAGWAKTEADREKFAAEYLKVGGKA